MFRSASLPAIRHGAEPILFDGGPVGCVCVHGFSASPEEMRWLGEYLQERGVTVFVPRLAGHGTALHMFARQHWMDWYEDVLDGVALLRARCRTVYAAGLSMGGLLTLRAAAAGVLDGAIVMAAPIALQPPLIRLSPVLKYIWRMVRIESQGLDERVRALQRAMGREDYGAVKYRERWPMAAIAQLNALTGEVRRHLAEVSVPLLLIYSKADRTVPYEHMAFIAGRVRSADLVQRTLEHSDHVLTQEAERETVYALVWEFLATRSGLPLEPSR